MMSDGFETTSFFDNMFIMIKEHISYDLEGERWTPCADSYDFDAAQSRR